MATVLMSPDRRFEPRLVARRCLSRQPAQSIAQRSSPAGGWSRRSNASGPANGRQWPNGQSKPRSPANSGAVGDWLLSRWKMAEWKSPIVKFFLRSGSSAPAATPESRKVSDLVRCRPMGGGLHCSDGPCSASNCRRDFGPQQELKRLSNSCGGRLSLPHLQQR